MPEPGEGRGRSGPVGACCALVRPGLRPFVRPLRHGEARTILAVFERLSERSRRLRFNGPKPCLRAAELRRLAAVDANRHVLVAHVEGDPEAVGVARLVRDGHTAEVAFEVADEYQRRGIGSALAVELIEHARAAGVTEITALVSSENRAAVALLRRALGALEIRLDGTELAIRAPLPR